MNLAGAIAALDSWILAWGGNADLAVLFVPLMIAIAALAFFWHFSRSKSILQKWAFQNGYEILDRNYRNFAKGPFFWTSARGQAVYHVTVRDQQGQIHSGWVRCGGWITGLWSDKAEVRWEY